MRSPGFEPELQAWEARVLDQAGRRPHNIIFHRKERWLKNSLLLSLLGLFRGGFLLLRRKVRLVVWL